MFALLHHGPPHCMAGQTHQTFTGSYCCWHHTLSFCSFHAQHQHHFMLNYVGNIKCVNNKMAIRIWNAKLVRAAIGINREYKAWIIKEIEEAQANGEWREEKIIAAKYEVSVSVCVVYCVLTMHCYHFSSFNSARTMAWWARSMAKRRVIIIHNILTTTADGTCKPEK